MKKIIINVVLLFGGIVNSQTIINSKLDSELLGNVYYKKTNYVRGWNPSHGNPSVYGAIGQNTWTWMWSHSNLGEGIVTEYDFQAGKTYQISFLIKTSSNVSNPNEVVLNSTANVRAVTGINSKKAIYIMPDIPTTSEIIWSKPVEIAMNNWKKISINFTPTNDNAQLWFYPLMTAKANANGGARIQMEIDDVFILPISKNQKIEMEQNKIIALSPNPVKKGGIIKITTKTSEVKETAVYDLNGNSRNLAFTKIDNNNLEVVIDDNFKNGIHMLNIINNDNTIFRKKIIIK
ncbi:T9SS type A sorting domain-containing protein [Flavobacterium sp.]|uniref:T9SS type A sorting domain-containing protein n=1 Tax=Flavobacterium sp. TaxID=239 RepID=UPI00286B7FD8|nr:T9SS type A sorting domain-containing protein [Flavobacterium sp.]